MWMIGSQDRDDAAKFRAWAVPIAHHISANVPLEVIAFIRDAHLVGPIKSIGSASVLGEAVKDETASRAIHDLIKHLASVSDAERPIQIAALLRIAAATRSNDYLHVLYQFEQMPADIRFEAMRDNAALLQQLVERRSAEKDLVVIRRNVTEEIAKLRCEDRVLNDAVIQCRRSRGIETWRTR
jgi:hypothetical protein